MIAVDQTEHREALVRRLQRQGIKDERVLKAIGDVPREAFLPPELREFAYRNSPLPIGQGQTISQPFVVALMAELLELQPTDHVLDIGTGSGYAAAVLAQLADSVYSIERHQSLATTARDRLRELGIENVIVKTGDGTKGWPQHAPFDAIGVAAAGPDVHRSLREQLRPGCRLVLPVGEEQEPQRLLRVRRTGAEDFEEEDLGSVAFVPLIGAEGWAEEQRKQARQTSETQLALPTLIRESCEPLDGIEECDLSRLLDRIGSARLVLIGEATHGTSEFYRMRAEITKALIRQKRCDFVAIEADWPDAARVNSYVTRRRPKDQRVWQAFTRFPTWMWRNQEVLSFIEWLRDHNLKEQNPLARRGFHGLDLYNMHGSIHAVLDYLDRVDPTAARVARERYGCLSPWEDDPATYGRAALSGRFEDCEEDVVQMLRDLRTRQADYAKFDGEPFLDAELNAKLIADAERYYRIMYYGSIESWNHRDRHMFETLEHLLAYHGTDSRAVIWAHNSHLGNAAATQMGAAGEFNIGQLCREQFGEDAYLIGQATDRGAVAAASVWDGPLETQDVRPAISGSYEYLCHESDVAAFLLPLRAPLNEAVREELLRPQTERQSHYFQASLPQQFDELIWFDETTAVTAITSQDAAVHPSNHPFATVD